MGRRGTRCATIRRRRRPRPAAAPSSPPCSAQIASARSSAPSTGWSVDSKPSTSRAWLPSPAIVSSASPASSRRQLDGYSPDCEIARTHSAPRAKSPKRTPAEARCSGRGCTRTHALVITPRMPSEPASRRSGLGPAPEPGRRRDSHTPDGRDRARGLQEVLDVRPDRREMARGAGGDPAAERRQLERLGEVAEREPVLAEGRLERGTGRCRRRSAPSGRPRPARAGRPARPGRSRWRRSDPRPAAA